MKQYAHLVDDAIQYGLRKVGTDPKKEKELIETVMDKLAVNFGTEITKIGMLSPSLLVVVSFRGRHTRLSKEFFWFISVSPMH